jgi:hypothetical protein
VLTLCAQTRHRKDLYPIANFGVGVDETIIGAVLKTALHFFAGFIGDVPLDVATELLKTIGGEVATDGSLVRTPFLHPDVFPDSWPARHELTAYPDGGHCLVTVLLFSGLAFTCRLPLAMAGTTGVRYTRVLTENFPRFAVDVPRPGALDWEDRPGNYDAAAYYAPIKARLARVHDHGMEQAIRAKCERAAKNANAMSANYGDVWDRYATQLQVECFDAAEVRQIVAIGKRLQREGRPPWEISVVNEDTARPDDGLRAFAAV